MKPFAYFVLGFLAFVPCSVVLWVIARETIEWLERPFIGGRNRGVCYFRTQEQLDFMRRVGFDYRYLCGCWYWVWRVHYPKGRPWERRVNWLAFRLLDIAAWLNRGVWSKRRDKAEIYVWLPAIGGPYPRPGVFGAAGLSWDGWRPARYL